MPSKTPQGPNTQPTPPQAVLDLLGLICARSNNTFSWYTSRKDRMWLTLKGFTPTVFSTSVELDHTSSSSDAVDALIVLYAAHLPKLRQEVPPITTWHTRKEVSERLQDAAQYIAQIWEDWQAGVAFWSPDYPSEPLHLVDKPDA